MPKLTPEIKQAIEDYRDEGRSMREIAQLTGVSHQSVSMYLRSIGADTSAAQTHAAVQARMRQTQARRLDFAERVLDHMDDLFDRMNSPYDQVVSTPNGVEIVTLPEPPLRVQADALKAFQTQVRMLDRLLQGQISPKESQTLQSTLSRIAEKLSNQAQQEK